MGQFPSYETPQGDQQTLLAPAWEQLVDQLRQAPRTTAAPGAGRPTLRHVPGERFARQARQEALAAAVAYTRSYTDLADLRDGPIVYTGHQPEMVHPGVWLKNFITARLAEETLGTAVHLLVDCDQCVRPAILAPGETPARPRFATVFYDQPLPPMPYEERPVADAGRFSEFPQAVAAAMGAYPLEPFVSSWWPEAIRIGQDERRLGHVLAKARHCTEQRWGAQSLQLPQSIMCQTRSFRQFFMEIVARRESFRTAYNEALAAYRTAHRIRNAAQPLPDLSGDDDCVETPFWIYGVKAPERRPLYAHRRGNELCLSDLRDIELQIPCDAGANFEDAIDALTEHERRGIKIRSRALTTTLYTRLFLGDLFIHGIGGAKYDQATDLLSQSFFHAAPPEFGVASGTLRLGIESPESPAGSPSTIRRQLREFQFHPETFLHEPSVADAPREALAEAVEAKQQAIASSRGLDHGRERHTRIAAANRRLRELLAPVGASLEASLQSAWRDEQAAVVLASREYAFCLYPRERLRSFLLREP